MTYSSTVPRDEWVGLNVALHRGRLFRKWLLAKVLLVSSGRQLQFAIPCGRFNDSTSAQPSGQ